VAPESRIEIGMPSLDARQATLLKTLVEQFIAEGRPVGSSRLLACSGLSVSSATVRSIMVDLAERGYVSAPHTSSGRIPTPLGYRFFVDSLLEPERLARQTASELHEKLRDSSGGRDGLTNDTSALLADLTRMAGVVSVPRSDLRTLRQIEFLPLSDCRVLVVLVVDREEVQNRVVQLSKNYSRESLERAAAFINRHAAGRYLFEVGEVLRRQVQEAEAAVGEELAVLMQQAVSESADADHAGLVIAGEPNLLAFAEIGSRERLVALLRALDRKREIAGLFRRCLDADGVQIFIGNESGVTVLDECSVVTAPYRVDGEVAGVLGVIGPTRMAYQRIVPLVDLTARMFGVGLKS